MRKQREVMKRKPSSTPESSEEEEEEYNDVIREADAKSRNPSSTSVNYKDYNYDVLMSCDDESDSVKEFGQRLWGCMESFGIRISEMRCFPLQAPKIFMPVFSKGSASKISCRWRLEYMMEYMRDPDTTYPLPIFFGIEPFQFLQEFRSRFKDEAVEQALIEISNIVGPRYIPATIGPNEMYNHIKEVCQMVSNKLKLSLLRTGGHLVGMDCHVQCIMDLLNLKVSDVQIIAILGGDGSGKTTVARAVYDKISSSFEGCSFLTDIDEMAEHSDNIRCLQAKLASDLLGRKCEVLQSVNEGINLIRERFCHMKVLLVLDDIRKSSHLEALAGQLNWFGPGSRIIITTEHNGFISLAHRIYKILHLEELDVSDGRTLQIFSRHAFRKDSPLQDFCKLSTEILDVLPCESYNPLAIEILGSILNEKLETEWGNMVINFRENIPLSFTQLEIVRMSYDNLNEKQKEMFLDISCFPNGMDKRVALLLWYDSLHSLSFHDFEVLICSCLVKIDTNNGIWMHRFVRDFARRVIIDRLRLPMEKTGFGHMDNTRFFKLEHEKICRITNSDCMQQRNLIWQSWFPPFLNAEHLAEFLKVLDLSWSKITESWEFWDQIKAPQLRVLNLTGCTDLMITPDFSFCPDLEILILEYCSRLVKIHPSVCMLQRLAIFNLRYCTELTMLPKEVGCLKALKEFLIDGTSIQEIPVSIGHQQKLQLLTAMNCSSLTHLPSSTCDLLYLTTLKLNSTNISELPCLIFQSVKLRSLSLRDCFSVTSIGPFVGEVEGSLVELDVSNTSISELPESIANLNNLRVLRMEFCFIREFPSRFSELSKLEEIYASWCRKLKNLPCNIWELWSLRILKLGYSSISSLPWEIRLLEILETLDLTSCNKLQSLPVLPTNLTSLHVQSKELNTFCDLHNLDNLKECSFSSDAMVEIIDNPEILMGTKVDPLYWLPQSSLMTLELCLPHIRNLFSFPESLTNLTLQCTNLENIPQFPSSLVALSIQDLRALMILPSVENLHNLTEMEIIRCLEIKKIEGLERLGALRVLSISGCGIRQLHGLDQLTSLMRLTLEDCESLTELGVGETLPNLVEMKISSCLNLKRIEGLKGLVALQVLSISNCGIESLDGIDEVKSLRRLKVSHCVSLRQVPDLPNLRSQ